jgi:hypothetical protein
MITFTFNAEKNIFDTVFSDMIEPEEIFKYMQSVNNNKKLPQKLNALIDVRTADFNFKPISIQNIVRANFRMNKAFQMINNAILTNNPDDATLTMFHHYTLGSDKYNVKIFTNREKAEEWLGSFK